jgi:hypothetical protein
MPGGAHLAAGVAGFEEAAQLRVAAFVEPFVRLGEQPAGPVQRVVLAAPMADGVVLHPTPALVSEGA